MLAFNLPCPIKYLKPVNFAETNTKYRYRQQHSASGLSLWLSLTHSSGFGEDKRNNAADICIFPAFCERKYKINWGWFRCE